MAGATTHASTPIGRAAAAQIPKMVRRLYWVIGRPPRVVTGRLVVGTSMVAVVVMAISLVR
jgi:hypothetical protein